ncbi:hypothetical protein PFISCL1PPCAC_12871, partial [Pristionchus fissidentatus]
LDRVKRAYELSVSIRLKEEQRLAVLAKLKTFSEQKDLYINNLEFFYLLYPIIFKELAKLLRCVIPQFDEIPDNLKCAIFTSLIGKFNALEFYYGSQGRFKRQGLCMCSLITVFDFDNLEEWLDVEGLTRKDDMMRTFRYYCDEYMTIFSRMQRTNRITETEFHSMIAILICQLDTTLHLPDKIQRVFDDTRAQVFEELQVYYREEMGLRDYSSRLGNIMTLSAALSELHRNSEEQINLYSLLFDIRSQDQMLQQALCCKEKVTK